MVAYDQPSVEFFSNAVIIARSPESVPPPARGPEPPAQPSTTRTRCEPATGCADTLILAFAAAEALNLSLALLTLPTPLVSNLRYES